MGDCVVDAVVIGAGVAGCCTARELMRYDLDVLVLEAGRDIACGATRANSGIVHAGYDPKPGTLKAKYNVEGSRLMPMWAQELGFDYEQNGAFVLAFSDGDVETLRELEQRARENGAAPVSVISGDEARAREPELSPDVVAALDVPASAICDPYGLALAALENAVDNGASLRFDARVVGLEAVDDLLGCGGAGFRLATAAGETFYARAVVNAAGTHADEINGLAGALPITITPRSGSYILFDKAASGVFGRTMFQPPSKAGKGVLVAHTVHGNLFVGPDAVAVERKDDTSCDKDRLAKIVSDARRTWPEASSRNAITNFSGVRATGSTGDFVIGEDKGVPGFFTVACYESPGLTSAPAVAVDIARSVADRLGAGPNPGFDPVRPAPRRFSRMTEEERAAAIAEDPAWGHIVCRCEEVTEGEIRQVLASPVPVLNLDALKWRTRAMMGRCHGGFCMPEAIDLLARRLGISPAEVDKQPRTSPVLASARSDYLELENARTGRGRAAHEHYDVVVVGAGAAGMAAASAARREGAERVLIVDRQPYLGGVLRQCIHDGFGLHRFGRELTGPEFADLEARQLDGCEVLSGATVLVIGEMGQPEQGMRTIDVATVSGMLSITARAVVMATGSRERGVGALTLAGTRPAGVYSAGTVQTFINLYGSLPGKRAVILGSGDIGLIMARRMALSGMEVEGVYEIAPYPSGLKRNIVQCLEDFDIPLHLSQTAVRLEGEGRLEAVWIADVDPVTRKAVPGSERRVACDTLVASIGLIPENELLRAAGVEIDAVTGGAVVDARYETSAPGVFACGNSLHVHDLADMAAAEGELAGVWAARFSAKAGAVHEPAAGIPVVAGEGVRYVVPQSIDPGNLPAELKLRVARPFEDARLTAVCAGEDGAGDVLASKRLLAAVPAEMLAITVKAAAAETMMADGRPAAEKRIVVSVEERGGA